MFTILDKNFDGCLSGDINAYPEGIVIPIDKPYRWTSADVIRKIKFAACRHFGKKKLKVGHAGTLDPLATGVLLVCIGNATKQAEALQSHDKEYIAGVAFGATTPSYDLEKDVDRQFPHSHITIDAVRTAAEGFIGEQDQVAPLFSAKSVDGVRAYELARKLFKEQGAAALKGENFDDAAFDEAAESIIRTSRINISEIEVLSFTPGGDSDICCRDEASVEGARKADDEVSKASSRINVADTSHLGLSRADIRIACSKGTYIRAFARDLGESLQSGAHLNSLQRSRSGIFHVKDCLSVEEAMKALGG